MGILGAEYRDDSGHSVFAVGSMALLIATLIGWNTVTFDQRFGIQCYFASNEGDIYVALAAKVRNEHGTNQGRVQR
jgi:hypothetical protein